MSSQIKETTELRIRKAFSFFWIFISDGTFFKSSKFIGNINIEEQKYYIRYLDFDDGWSYQYFWGKWYTEWKFIKII